MKATTMKKRFVKGVLAAAFAMAAVVSVPQYALNAKSDNTITASAACSHNYRHYGTWGGWYTYYYDKMVNEVHGGYAYAVTYKYRAEKRHYYSTCVNCGVHDGGIISTQTRNHVRLYKVSEKLLGRA